MQPKISLIKVVYAKNCIKCMFYIQRVRFVFIFEFENLIMSKILYTILMLSIVFGCSKTGNDSKPTLTYLGVSNKTFATNKQVSFNFEFTNPITETAKDTLIVTRKFFTCPYFTLLHDTVPLPSYENTANITNTFDYSFRYNGGNFYANGCYDTANDPVTSKRTDTIVYSFFIKDKHGNKSNVVVSDKILALKN
jgi:hypothetical protein